ncbi:MAG: c-type cytochrome [Methylomonas sp.]|jgi:cytochrome c553
MHNFYNKIGVALFLSFYALGCFAADAVAGKNRAAVCQGCHGPAGVSENNLFPNLAGQNPAYLEAQLNNFKSGARDNQMMRPIADGLTEPDIRNLAAYFAGLPAKSAGGDISLAKAGKDKAGMCMGCHGQNLLGNIQTPGLAGQHPEYLAKQMNDFKSGARKSGQMNMIAKSLSDGDIKAISAFLGSFAR